MTTISINDLATIIGGVTSGGPGSKNAQYKEMCMTPSPQVAHDQYKWMVKNEIPDASEKPGVKHRVVSAIGQLCHWSPTDQ